MSEQTELEKLWTGVNVMINTVDKVLISEGETTRPEFWRGYVEGMLRVRYLIEKAQINEKEEQSQ